MHPHVRVTKREELLKIVHSLMVCKNHAQEPIEYLWYTQASNVFTISIQFFSLWKGLSKRLDHRKSASKMRWVLFVCKLLLHIYVLRVARWRVTRCARKRVTRNDWNAQRNTTWIVTTEILLRLLKQWQGLAWSAVSHTHHRRVYGNVSGAEWTEASRRSSRVPTLRCL